MKSWTNRPEQEKTQPRNRISRQLREDNRHLREQIDYLPRKLFSPKSEKNRECDGQISIFDEAEKESVITAAAEGGKITIKYERIRKPKATHDETMGDLPEMERTVVLPEGRKPCAICGAGLEWMSREFVRDLSVLSDSNNILMEL
ncbi:MAG TPA: transposase [Lachnospiraceae bacterium]|nr:transposase [Lachnospiraceae bacterium]